VFPFKTGNQDGCVGRRPPLQTAWSFWTSGIGVVMLTESSFEIAGRTIIEPATTLALEYVYPVSPNEKGQGSSLTL